MTHRPWLPGLTVVPRGGGIDAFVEVFNCQLISMQTAKRNSQQQRHSYQQQFLF